MTTTLTDYLTVNKKGTFCIAGRKIGTKAGWRQISVFRSNHQDIWIYCAKNKAGNLRDRATVDARLDRRTGKDDWETVTADDYEVFV